MYVAVRKRRFVPETDSFSTDFKPSPFYEILETLSPLQDLPGIFAPIPRFVSLPTVLTHYHRRHATKPTYSESHLFDTASSCTEYAPR